MRMTIKQVEVLIKSHMSKWLSSEWSFGFYSTRKPRSNARTRTISLGRCNYNRKMVCLNSDYAVAADKSHVLDTILHEIAHGMSTVDEWGFRARGHGKEWKENCKRIGCSGERCNKDRAWLTVAKLIPHNLIS